MFYTVIHNVIHIMHRLFLTKRCAFYAFSQTYARYPQFLYFTVDSVYPNFKDGTAFKSSGLFSPLMYIK